MKSVLVWLALIISGLAIGLIYVRNRQPGLLQRRLRVGSGTPRWDRGFVAIIRVAVVTMPIVAGIEGQVLGWRPTPLWLRSMGAVVVAAGLFLLFRSMAESPHFETTLRIQGDTHRIVDTGPYHFVRHPGYVGIGLVFLGSPLLLGSAWALIPAGLGFSCTVVRTAFEDHFLRLKLHGYREYSARVRYRLIPGLW